MGMGLVHYNTFIFNFTKEMSPYDGPKVQISFLNLLTMKRLSCTLKGLKIPEERFWD